MHSNNFLFSQWTNQIKGCITLILLLFTVSLIAQTNTLDFVKHTARSTSDVFYSYDVEVDANGNYYLANKYTGTTDFDPSSGTYNLNDPDPAYGDLYFSKYDPSGSFLWAKKIRSINSSNYVVPGPIALDGSGNFYMAGVYRGTIDFNPGTGTNNLTCPNYSCAYLVKLNSSGAYVDAWSIIESTSSELVWDLKVDHSTNDIYLAGYYWGSADFQEGSGSLLRTSYGSGPDGFLLKLNSSATALWLRTIQSSTEVHCRSFARNASGDLYISGLFKGTTYFGGSNIVSAVSPVYDSYILKINSTGAVQWVNAYQGTGHINLADLELSPDETNLIVGGRFKGVVDFDPGAGTNNINGSNYYDICLISLSSSGTTAWTKHYSSPSTGGTNLADIEYDNMGDIHLCGAFWGSVDLDPGPGSDAHSSSSNSYWDGFYSKLLNDGSFENSYVQSGTESNYVNGMYVQSPAVVYLTGRFAGTVDFDDGAGSTTLTSAGSYDTYLCKLTSCSPMSSTDVISAGNSYTWINGTTYTADNNTATYTATAINGCDSIVSLDLTIFNPGGVSGATSWVKGDESMYRESNLSVAAVHGDTVAAAKNFVGGNANLLKANATNSSNIIYKTTDSDLNYNPFTAHNNAAFVKTNLAFNDVFSSTNGLTYYVVFTAVSSNPDMLIGGAFTPTQTILTDSPCGNPRCYTGLRNNGSRVAGHGPQLGFLSTVTPVSGEPTLAGGYSDFNTDEFNVVNGGWNSRSANPFQEYTGAVYKYRIFGYNTNYKTGNFAEAMTFDRMLTEAERRKVESYLGIKYGITLHPFTGAQGDYVSSAGTVFWDSQTNTAYHNRIVGLGRDDISGLNQKQARIGSGDLVAYIGTLSASNAANTATFASDDSFFTIGDNDEAKSATASSNAEIPGTCSLYSRIAREWKVSRTNMAEAISLEIILGDAATSGGVRVTDLRLLVDDDGDFSNGGTTCYATGASGLTINFNNGTGVFTFSNLSTSILPNNATRFITIASVSDATALPVDLYSFSGSCEEGQPLLKWQSMSEYNNDYYLIEKSKDGRIFEPLNTVAGKGTIDEISHYYYIDTDNAAGGTYYRLSQVDFDGTKSVFKTIYLNCAEDIMIDIYPNPFEQTLHVKAEDGSGLFTVRDLRGSIVFQSRYLQGEQTFNMPDKLNAGVYTVEFRSDSGSILHRKMIKQ